MLVYSQNLASDGESPSGSNVRGSVTRLLVAEQVPRYLSPSEKNVLGRFATTRRVFVFDDLAFVVDILEAHGDLFAYARLLHSDTEEGGRGGHGLLRVSHDDELGPVKELGQDVNKATNVGFVKRCVDFVQYAEWTGAILEDSQ